MMMNVSWLWTSWRWAWRWGWRWASWWTSWWTSWSNLISFYYTDNVILPHVFYMWVNKSIYSYICSYTYICIYIYSYIHQKHNTSIWKNKGPSQRPSVAGPRRSATHMSWWKPWLDERHDDERVMIMNVMKMNVNMRVKMSVTMNVMINVTIEPDFFLLYIHCDIVSYISICE